MNISIKEILKREKIIVSNFEKEKVDSAKKKYLLGNDKGITIEKSYKNFLNYFSKMK